MKFSFSRTLFETLYCISKIPMKNQLLHEVMVVSFFFLSFCFFFVSFFFLFCSTVHLILLSLFKLFTFVLI